MTENSSMFTLTTMEIEHAESVCSWRYPQPYDIYNWQEWLDMKTNSVEFGDPRIRSEQYAAVLNHETQLVGFAQFFPMVGVTRLGFGMRPDQCGAGKGVAFVRAIVEDAKRRNPRNEIDLEVLTWNLRAYKAYEKAGFVHTDTYERPTPTGVQAVHCMVFK